MQAHVFLWAVLILLAPSSRHATSSRILAVFPHVGHSHLMVFEPLLQALASRGHEVHVVSHFPRATPLARYHDISVRGSLPLGAVSFAALGSRPPLLAALALARLGAASCRAVLAAPSVQRLLASNQTFDLVFTELFNTDCFLGFAPRFRAPHIALSSCALMPWAGARFGNPDHPAYVPNIMASLSDRMSLSERLQNTLVHVLTRPLYYWTSSRHAQHVAAEFFGQAMPTIEEIARNTSLIFVNTHASLNKPRPLSPSVIEVGGIHVQPPNKLSKIPESHLEGSGHLDVVWGLRVPVISRAVVGSNLFAPSRAPMAIRPGEPCDLDDWLNGASDGVVFFSMGSTLRAATLPAATVAALVAAFSALPQRVLWKWEGEALPGQPSNVRTDTWLPQRDVLGHPKVRVFVTHCGLLGTMEAVASGVPMVGIPVYGDQGTNCRAVESLGVAVRLDYQDITKETVLEAITAVLSNTSYHEAAERLSRQFADRPTSPMATAVFWTEYVIRHGGAHHLRPASVHLAWYQYLLLDVALVAALGAAVAAAIGAVVARKMAAVVRGRWGQQEKRKQL